MVNTRSSGGGVGLTFSQPGSVGLGAKSSKITKSRGSGSRGAGGGKQPQKTGKAGSRWTRCQPCVDLHRPCDRAQPVCGTCEKLARPIMCVWPDRSTAPNSAMRRLQDQNLPAAGAAAAPLVAPAPAAAPANVPRAPAPQPQADDAGAAAVAGTAQFGDAGYFDTDEEPAPQETAEQAGPSNGLPTREELAALDAAAPYESSTIYFRGDSDNEQVNHGDNSHRIRCSGVTRMKGA